MSAPVIPMRTPAETALIERFAAEKSTLPGAAKARAEAFARFEAKGLPGRRVEAYHYTDLRNMMRSLAPVAPDALVPAQLAAFEGFAHRISLVNGRYQGGTLPEGVILKTLADFLTDPLADKLASTDAALYPGFAMGKASDIVVDLNTALMRDGVMIRVEAGADVRLHVACAETLAARASILSRVIIDIEEGACLTLVESHEGPDGIDYQVNDVVEFRLGKGAKVEHIRLNRSGDAALVLSSVAALIGEDGEFSTLNVALGAEISRHQVFVTYAGENVKTNIRGATMLKGEQHHDTTLVVDHAVPHGTSRELFKTIVDGSAQGVFQGKIIVRPHAQKTDGQMASNALLLSDDAGMSNKPELEIFADDVVCAHGATCGALDENQLFYLQARGIPRKLAEAILVEAFVAEALDEVSDEPLREMLAGLISDWMQARVG